jgi:limonene-1,2-epoxide hydrolase
MLPTICTGFEAQVHRIAANGPTVLTERTDALERGAFRAEFWVCGVFEVRHGAITSWRDYFDWANVLAAFARGGARAALAKASSGLARR